MRVNGTVKFFNTSKGFGFIARDDGGKDVFVHSSGADGVVLTENLKVSFDVAKTQKGDRAENVQAV